MRKRQPGLLHQLGLLIGCLFGVVFLAFLLGASPGKASASIDDPDWYYIPDGVWVGAFSGSDAITVNGIFADAFFNGTFNLEVVGSVVDGTFKASGVSSSENSEAYAIATFSSVGILGGTSGLPTMQAKSSAFEFAINMFSLGIQTTEKVEMLSGFPIIELKLVEIANCNSLSGNFDSSVVQSLENADANVMHVQTEFTITRTSGIIDENPEKYQEALAALMQKADALVSETIANQALNGDQLWDVLAEARELDLGVRTDDLCYSGEGSNPFSSSIVGVVAKLINLAHGHPEWFTAAQINWLAHAATYVGAIGSGSPNEELAIELTNKLENIADIKLAELDKNPVCIDIYSLYTVAEFLGTGTLIIKTNDMMNKYQCEGY